MKRLPMIYLISIIVAVHFFSASDGLADTLTLTFVEHNTNFAFADTGKPGDSPGDIMTFANKVFDAKNQRQVGSDSGFCIRTVVSEAYECNWTTFIDGGQITVEGPFYDAKDAVLAVIGGTGTYKNTSGQLKLHIRDAKATEIDFVFEISGLQP
jgi:allene oxide cyclase